MKKIILGLILLSSGAFANYSSCELNYKFKPGVHVTTLEKLERDLNIIDRVENTLLCDIIFDTRKWCYVIIYKTLNPNDVKNSLKTLEERKQ